MVRWEIPAIIAILVIAFIGIVSYLVPRVVPPVAVVVEYDGYFKSVGLEVAKLEAPYSVQDFDVNPVGYEDEDQVTDGNATLDVDNGTTLTAEKVLYLHFETKDTARSLTLEYESDNADNFNEDTVAIKEVALEDYDTGELVEEINGKTLEEGYVSGVFSEGEYILGFTFKIKGATMSAVEGTLDQIGELEGKLDAPDAPTDEPTEFENFKIYAVSV